MKIGERIKKGRLLAVYSQERLAELVGVSRSACCQWERGLSVPSVENLSRLAIALQIRFEWLATGRGRMDLNTQFETYEQDTVYDPAEIVALQDLKELITIYHRLPVKQKNTLLAFMKTL